MNCGDVVIFSQNSIAENFVCCRANNLSVISTQSSLKFSESDVMALILCRLLFEVYMWATWLLYSCTDQLAFFILRVLAKEALSMMVSKCCWNFFPYQTGYGISFLVFQIYDRFFKMLFSRVTVKWSYSAWETVISSNTPFRVIKLNAIGKYIMLQFVFTWIWLFNFDGNSIELNISFYSNTPLNSYLSKIWKVSVSSILVFVYRNYLRLFWSWFCILN